MGFWLPNYGETFVCDVTWLKSILHCIALMRFCAVFVVSCLPHIPISLEKGVWNRFSNELYCMRENITKNTSILSRHFDKHTLIVGGCLHVDLMPNWKSSFWQNLVELIHATYSTIEAWTNNESFENWKKSVSLTHGCTNTAHIHSLIITMKLCEAQLCYDHHFHWY